MSDELVKVALTTKGARAGEIDHTKFEVESVIAASGGFEYWTFLFRKDEEGKQKIRFVAKSEVLQVIMEGLPDEEDDKKSNVVPLRAVKDDES